MQRIGPETWRFLGFGVSAGYASLGLYQLLQPARASVEIYDIPRSGGRRALEPSAAEETSILVSLLAARDLSMAVTIGILAYQRKYHEAGVAILAGVLLCAADTLAVWKRKGPSAGMAIGTGAAIWALIGIGLQMVQ